MVSTAQHCPSFFEHQQSVAGYQQGNTAVHFSDSSSRHIINPSLGINRATPWFIFRLFCEPHHQPVDGFNSATLPFIFRTSSIHCWVSTGGQHGGSFFGLVVFPPHHQSVAGYQQGNTAVLFSNIINPSLGMGIKQQRNTAVHFLFPPHHQSVAGFQQGNTAVHFSNIINPSLGMGIKQQRNTSATRPFISSRHIINPSLGINSASSSCHIINPSLGINGATWPFCFRICFRTSSIR